MSLADAARYWDEGPGPYDDELDPESDPELYDAVVEPELEDLADKVEEEFGEGCDRERLLEVARSVDVSFEDPDLEGVSCDPMVSRASLSEMRAAMEWAADEMRQATGVRSSARRCEMPRTRRLSRSRSTRRSAPVRRRGSRRAASRSPGGGSDDGPGEPGPKPRAVAS